MSPSCCAAVQGRTEISAILQEGHWTLGGNDRISEAGEFGWPIGRESDRQFEPRFFERMWKRYLGITDVFFSAEDKLFIIDIFLLFFYPYLCCAKLRWATIEKQSNMLFAPPKFASIYKTNVPATSCLWQKFFQEQKWTLLGFDQKSHFCFGRFQAWNRIYACTQSYEPTHMTQVDWSQSILRCVEQGMISLCFIQTENITVPHIVLYNHYITHIYGWYMLVYVWGTLRRVPNFSPLIQCFRLT